MLAEILALKQGLQHKTRLRGLLEALQPAQGEIDRLGFTVTEFGAAQQGWDHIPRLLSLVEALQPPERQIDRLGRMPSQIIPSQQRPQPIAGERQVEVSRAPGHRGVEQVGRGVGWNRPQPLVEKVTGRRVEALAGQPGGDQRVPVGHRFARPDGQTHQCPQRICRFAGFRLRQRLPQPSSLLPQPLVRLRTQRGICLRFLRPQQPAQGGGIPPQHPSTAAGWSEAPGQHPLAQVVVHLIPQHLGQHLVGHHIVRRNQLQPDVLQPAQLEEPRQGFLGQALLSPPRFPAGRPAHLHHGLPHQGRRREHGRRSDQLGRRIRWQEIHALHHHQLVFHHAPPQPPEQVATAHVCPNGPGQGSGQGPTLQFHGDEQRQDRPGAAQLPHPLLAQQTDSLWGKEVEHAVVDF